MGETKEERTKMHEVSIGGFEGGLRWLVGLLVGRSVMREEGISSYMKERGKSLGKNHLAILLFEKHLCFL